MSTELRGKRVIVTGGAGFIGSHLVEQLVGEGAHVVVVDNMVNGRHGNLAHLPQRMLDVVERDIRDTSGMSELVRSGDTIFHLACLGVRHSLRSPKENHEVNATATLTFLDVCAKAGVRRFVHVSSSEVYGTARTVPIAEDHPTFPHTVYGASKLAGEAYARAAFLTRGFPAVVVRPFNAYGPRSHHEGDSGEVIPRMMVLALAGRPLIVFGTGKQTRDFTHVEDTARGILLAALSDDLIGSTINIGSGTETAISDLADAIREISGRDVPIEHHGPRPGDVGRLLADTTRAREVLGFNTSVSLQEGLPRLRKWYEQSNVPVATRLEQLMHTNWA